MTFTKKKWVNVPDPSNLPPVPEGQDALARFDADNMNRIEDGIKNIGDNLNSLSGNLDSLSDNLNSLSDNLDSHSTDMFLHNKSLLGGGSIGQESTSTSGGASGYKASTTVGGAVGQESTSTSGGAVGYKATSESGGSIGEEATTSTGGSVGFKASSESGGASGQESTSTSGGAVGYKATTEVGGSIGQESTSTSGGAVGYKATTTTGGAVGASASSTEGGAIGDYARETLGGAAIGFDTFAEAGGAVGSQSKAIHGGAVGNAAIAGNGFSGGAAATVGKDLNDKYIDAIQLGEGTNNNPHTLQIYNHTLMDADGIIPIERLTKAPRIAVGSYTGTGTCGEDNPNILTFDFDVEGVFVCSSDTKAVFIKGMEQTNVLSHVFSSNNGTIQCSIVDKTLSWYADKSTSTTLSYRIEAQLNKAGVTYYWVACQGGIV